MGGACDSFRDSWMAACVCKHRMCGDCGCVRVHFNINHKCVYFHPPYQIFSLPKYTRHLPFLKSSSSLEDAVYTVRGEGRKEGGRRGGRRRGKDEGGGKG